MENILFVCTGNTCRSPMAEAILNHKTTDIHVKSAGVFAVDGNPTSKNTVEALREEGIRVEHYSQLLTEELVDWATCILTMTQSHKQLVLDRFPQAITKTHTIREYATNVQGDVIDPFGGPLSIYRKTYAELTELADVLISKIGKKS
jgi:protein-tyrosine-phosphatase